MDIIQEMYILSNEYQSSRWIFIFRSGYDLKPENASITIWEIRLIYEMI